MSIHHRNLLLAALPEGEAARLRPHLEQVQLRQGEVTQQPDGPARWVYFPEGATLAVAVSTGDGQTIEAGMIGYGGAADVCVALEAGTAAHQVQVLIPGEALRIRADVLRHELTLCPVLHRLLLRYALFQLLVLRQLLACNSLHPVGGCLARLLLQLCDHAQAYEFRITHETLASALGVRRAGVTEALIQLSEAGAVERGRGRICVKVRSELERASCECYQIIRGGWERHLASLAAPARCAANAAPRAVPVNCAPWNL